jgi:hypothetical protein
VLIEIEFFLFNLFLINLIIKMKFFNFALIYFLIIVYLQIYIIHAEAVQIENSKCIMNSKPKNETECNKFNDKNYYCCFLSPVEANTTNLCYPYQINSYTGQGTINYAQISYNINCGLGSENFSFESSGVKMCGILNPVEQEECFIHSTNTNSCCYFKHDGITGCYFVGEKFFGKTMVDNLLLSCQGGWIIYDRSKYSWFYFIILIFTIFY